MSYVTLYGQPVTIATAYLDVLPVDGTIAREVGLDFGSTATGLGNPAYTYHYVIGVAGLGRFPTETATIN